ncbi:unnamed protein product [Microthlaspi erraticum]|uniref:Uncharacterized protein n=1 Tax=Microthlaspi erraticum TaxID=1685480 RepID=A0A6D2HZ21_9BRAS|nr:unnamed protein product [Microthlaspi erraticum]
MESNSSSSAGGAQLTRWTGSPLCRCLESPIVLTSWVDNEPSHGWQKRALIKARNRIRALKTEVEYYKRLKDEERGKN